MSRYDEIIVDGIEGVSNFLQALSKLPKKIFLFAMRSIAFPLFLLGWILNKIKERK